MLQILKELDDPGAFSPNETALLVEAFDEAWAYLEKIGICFNTTSERERARRELGKYLFDDAMTGERDKDRLRDNALLAYGKPPLRDAV